VWSIFTTKILIFRTTITSENLLVTASDGNIDREIMFIVKNAPRMGRLMQKIEIPGIDKSPKWIDAKNFTQRHVNESRIAFEHNRPFANLTAFDSANLEVVTDFGVRRLDVILNVRISVMASGISGGINNFIQTDKFVLAEGSSATLYSRHFNTTGVLDFILKHRQKAADKSADFYHPPARLRLQLTSLPEHGVLYVSKSRTEKGQYFEQVHHFMTL
jgi:hypothetical protein